MQKVKTKTISSAIRILAEDIQYGDGVANLACTEAADRLDELETDIKLLKRGLLDIQKHVKVATPDGYKMSGVYCITEKTLRLVN